MLPKRRRLTTSSFLPPKTGKNGSKPKPNEFSRTFSSPLISLRATRLESDIPTRLAVIVSKKTAKTAVSRNRLRRKVYGALGAILPQVREGFSLLLYPKKEVEKVSFAELSTTIHTVLKDARILKIG